MDRTLRPTHCCQRPGKFQIPNPKSEIEGGLYFTIHNHTTLTRTATITIETASLGLTDPASATITDLATDQPVGFNVVDGDIVVSMTLGPWQTRVLQINDGVAPPTPTPTPHCLYLPLIRIDHVGATIAMAQHREEVTRCDTR